MGLHGLELTPQLSPSRPPYIRGLGRVLVEKDAMGVGGDVVRSVRFPSFRWPPLGALAVLQCHGHWGPGAPRVVLRWDVVRSVRFPSFRGRPWGLACGKQRHGRSRT